MPGITEGMSICPTCGQPTKPAKMGATQILELLKLRAPHREVYRLGRDPNRWFVSHGGGEADGGTVKQLIKSGGIQSVYSNCPDAYHIGRIWDFERTMAARKILGVKAAPDYFVGDA